MKFGYILYFIGCYFLLFANEVLAQQHPSEVKFRRLMENSQLSNSNITSICQDFQGYLWVGTNDGLNRFDGYDFKIYRNIENDSTSIGQNSIQSVFEDSNGVLWVNTINSILHHYNRTTDNFSRLPEISTKYHKIRRIIEGFGHHIWIGGLIDNEAFVAKLDRQTGDWTTFLLFPSKEGIYSILQYRENEFWLGTRSDGLYYWNRETNVLKQYLHDPSDANSLPGNLIEDITKDEYGNLWIGTGDGGLCQFNIDKKTFKNFTAQPTGIQTPLPSNSVKDMCQDGQYLWIATENGGLSRMETKTETLTNFFYSKIDPNTIVNNSLWSLYKDQQHRLWVGSAAKGLCVLDPMEYKFSTLKISKDTELVNAILKDSKGRMWIGTEDGLLMQDRYGDHFFRNVPDQSSSISSNAVLAIYEDHNDRIWIGLWNGGLNRFDESTNSFVRYVSDPEIKGSLTSPHVFSIAESIKTGELLVGTFGGLNILNDEKSGIFENLFNYPTGNDEKVFKILVDSKENIWVSSLAGLSKYDLSTKVVKHFDILNGKPSMGRNEINCIAEDHNGEIWIGGTGGLFRMVSPSEFIPYKNGGDLLMNIMWITEDAQENLWLGTTRGLMVFNPMSEVFKIYDESDGLPSKELRRNSFFQAEDGQIFIGGKGVNTFYPDSIVSNANQPAVLITNLKVFNQFIKPNSPNGILKDDISQTKEIYLEHIHTFFSLHYVGLNFTASYKNQYAYKLEGFDEDWVYVGTQRFATFTNLDPGTYIFRVKASNNDGIWNEDGASLIIHVLPPWWLTWWAYLIWLFLLIAVVYMIVRFRTSYINAQRTRLKEQVKLGLHELELKNARILMQAEELNAFNDALQDLNESLEKTVKERTNELILKNKKLAEYAFINAHNLRVPVANIKGVIQLFEVDRSKDEILELLEILKGQSNKLDAVLFDIKLMLEKDELLNKGNSRLSV